MEAERPGTGTRGRHPGRLTRPVPRPPPAPERTRMSTTRHLVNRQRRRRARDGRPSLAPVSGLALLPPDTSGTATPADAPDTPAAGPA
ncbi:hypothetical protein G3M55_22045, partial [Streptomyces sp. SID8455]|nr:hypothetical protein [Streptomyces sp. SID8455]